MGNRMRYPKEVVVVEDRPGIGCGGFLILFFLFWVVTMILGNCGGI